MFKITKRRSGKSLTIFIKRGSKLSHAYRKIDARAYSFLKENLIQKYQGANINL